MIIRPHGKAKSATSQLFFVNWADDRNIIKGCKTWKAESSILVSWYTFENLLLRQANGLRCESQKTRINIILGVKMTVYTSHARICCIYIYIHMSSHVSIHKECTIIHNNTHHHISLCCVGRCMSFNMCCGRLCESTRSGREAGSPTIGECHALADE